MNYMGLGLGLVAAAAVVAVLGARRVPAGEARRRHWAAVAIAGALLIALTAVFDNVIIAVGIVDYDPSKISGAYVGLAPLEDFSYAIACALALPALWVLLRSRKEDSDG